MDSLTKTLDPFFTKMANHLLAQNEKCVVGRIGMFYDAQGRKCALGTIPDDASKFDNTGAAFRGKNYKVLMETINPDLREIDEMDLLRELAVWMKIHDIGEPHNWEKMLTCHAETRGYTWRP